MNWLKRFLTYLLIPLMTLGPWASPAYAVNLGDAFNSLLSSSGGTGSYNAPGMFQSGVRNTISAGGFNMRVPRVGPPSATLMSFTPPSFNSSCSGVSAHFGGLSFVNGSEIKQMISALSSGAAVGFVVTIAIKVTCPMCEDVISKLREAAAFAAKLSMDGCQAGFAIGAALANKAMPKSQEIGPSSSAKCAAEKSESNAEPDSFSSWFNGCSSLQKVFDSHAASLKKFLTDAGISTSSPTGEAAVAKKLCEMGVGNKTWTMLQGFDYGALPSADPAPGSAEYKQMYDSYTRKIILMNVLGVQLQGFADSVPTDSLLDKYKSLSCQTGDLRMPSTIAPSTKNPDVYCAPRFVNSDLRTLMGYFMCGIPSAEGQTAPGLSATSAAFCQDFKLGTVDSTGFKFTNVEGLYVCRGGVKDKLCNEVILTSPYNALAADGTSFGYLAYVDDLLSYGVRSVRNNTPFTQDPAKGAQLISLINAAPFPLYQVINAAAVYPQSAASLISSMTILIAQQLAVSQLNDLMRLTGQTSGSGGQSCLDDRIARELLAFTEQTRAFTEKTDAEFAKNYTMQQTIIQSIRQINIAIQKQVLTTDMLGASRLAQTINSSVNPNVQ